jgi:hypothetical protein
MVLDIATKKDILATEQNILQAKNEIIQWMVAGAAMLMLAIIGLYFKR